jgi:hypothetical protein
MTPDDWKMVVDEVEGLWGKSAKWRNADRAFKYARAIPAAAARSAVEVLFMAGGAAPYPADLISTARSLMDDVMTADEVARYCETNGHAFGVVDEVNGVRTGICGRCRVEVEKPAGLMRTLGEVEDGIPAGKEHDDIVERIAP